MAAEGEGKTGDGEAGRLKGKGGRRERQRVYQSACLHIGSSVQLLICESDNIISVCNRRRFTNMIGCVPCQTGDT